jgi:DNA polymerase III alpha subunit
VKVDQYGRAEVTEEEAFAALYQNKIADLESVYLDNIDIIQQYNRSRQINADKIPNLSNLPSIDISVKEFDKLNQNQWFMPANYCPNLIEWLFSKCDNDEQAIRVSQELELFIQYGMMDLLHYIKYLIDTMRKEGIVWGVGRGSSVASYVLYLIGVHKVDSLKYNLDIREFLK